MLAYRSIRSKGQANRAFSSMHLPKNSNQALGIARYAKEFIYGADKDA